MILDIIVIVFYIIIIVFIYVFAHTMMNKIKYTMPINNNFDKYINENKDNYDEYFEYKDNITKNIYNGSYRH